MTDTFDTNSLLQFELSSAPILAAELSGADRIRSNYAAEFAVATARLADEKFASDFQNLCPIRGASLPDYLYRVIILDGIGALIGSIRFKGLDVRKPFVEIECADFDLPDHLPAVGRRIRNEFEVFAPRSFRFYSSTA